MHSLRQIDDDRTKRFSKAKPEREALKWRTTGNFIDCGVFVMRHMETYMGENIKKWDCGLAEEGATQKAQLDNLRYKYVAKMLLSNVNKQKELVVREMNEFAKMPADRQKQLIEEAKATFEERFDSFV